MLILSTILFLLIGIAAVAARKKDCQIVESKTLKCNFIPTNIPEGISKVLILDYKGKNEVVVVNSSFFQSDNWSKVEHLEFVANISNDYEPFYLTARCFQGLQSLKSLRIQSTNVEMDPNTFVGLDSVKSLDMSGCVRLRLKNLISSLNGTDKLPGLQKLKIANINFNLSPLAAIDRPFTNAMKTKGITHLDLSGSKIFNLDLAAIYEDFKYLKVLNVSLASITGDFLGSTRSTDLLKLENQTFVDVADFSYIQTFWIYLYGKFSVYNQVYQSSELGAKFSLFSPKVVNISGWMGEHVEFWTYNVTVNITGPFPARSEELIVKQTNFRRLDATVYCTGFEALSLQRLNIAQNGLEFLHPSILSCMPNLKTLDLSNNQMFKMVEENSPLFAKLFHKLQHLNMLTLSKNNLKMVPDSLFYKNQELEVIDLSYNELSQVTFSLNKLSKLHVLNLQNNKLKILNEISLYNLDSIPRPTSQNDTMATVTMKYNQLQCSECEAKSFIHWLTQTDLVRAHTCINENGGEQNINDDTTELVENICRRKMIIISTSVSSTLFIIIVSVTLTVLYKLHKRKTLKANRANAKHLLHKGKDQYEFAVFLSYSSLDDIFVKDYVFNQLNDNLRTTTGLNRDLVCSGDAHLRSGFNVLDETVSCIERASVVIAVVSDNYCQSNYCQTEVDQAYRLNKPIILMLKEHVQEERMMPTMKMLFKKNVRILWSLEKGELVLKTTWENVCTSILDLVTPEKKT